MSDLFVYEWNVSLSAEIVAVAENEEQARQAVMAQPAGRNKHTLAALEKKPEVRPFVPGEFAVVLWGI